MAKNCPHCSKETEGPSKKASAWLPILTAVGVSAAALYVLQRVRKSSTEMHADKDVLADCARAAKTLDKRIDEESIRLAG